MKLFHTGQCFKCKRYIFDHGDKCNTEETVGDYVIKTGVVELKGETNRKCPNFK